MKNAVVYWTRQYHVTCVKIVKLSRVNKTQWHPRATTARTLDLCLIIMFAPELCCECEAIPSCGQKLGLFLIVLYAVYRKSTKNIIINLPFQINKFWWQMMGSGCKVQWKFAFSIYKLWEKADHFFSFKVLIKTVLPACYPRSCKISKAAREAAKCSSYDSHYFQNYIVIL